MCLAAPSRVVEVGDGTAITVCFGRLREVSLLLLDEEISVGDYLLIQAGGFAFERVAPERAEETLLLMAELMELGGDERSWGQAA